MVKKDIWSIVESVRSMSFMDQKDLMNHIIPAWNGNPKLHSHALSLLKNEGSRRGRRRNLSSIANEIGSHLRKHGYITWKTANKLHSLGKAEAFARVMTYIPDAVRSTKLHKEGGRNWYFVADSDPSKWIASHEDGPVVFIDYPDKVAGMIVEIIEKKHASQPRVNVHKILVTEKTLFNLPPKFNSLYREWADQHLTPLLEAKGYIANQPRKVYTKN